MAEPLKLKGRHAVRDKDLVKVNESIRARFGVDAIPAGGDVPIEKARADPFEVLLLGGKVFVVLEGLVDDEPVPTLRALMANKPERAWATVDMGAIPFLRNGADVMSPGITEADPAIAEGDLVWVRDEKHGMPLALGRALLGGAEMAAATKGKAIATLHYVGDDLWSLGVE